MQNLFLPRLFHVMQYTNQNAAGHIPEFTIEAEVINANMSATSRDTLLETINARIDTGFLFSLGSQFLFCRPAKIELSVQYDRMLRTKLDINGFVTSDTGLVFSRDDVDIFSALMDNARFCHGLGDRYSPVPPRSRLVCLYQRRDVRLQFFNRSDNWLAFNKEQLKFDGAFLSVDHYKKFCAVEDICNPLNSHLYFSNVFGDEKPAYIENEIHELQGGESLKDFKIEIYSDVKPILPAPKVKRRLLLDD